MRPCFECGEPADQDHHVVPNARGGTRTIPLCPLCHAKIHDKGISTSVLSREGLAQKRELGEWFGRPPYGWRINNLTCTLVEVPAEQLVLTRIRQLHKEGVSYRKISEKLAEEGSLTLKGKPFGEATIQRYVKHPRTPPKAHAETPARYHQIRKQRRAHGIGITAEVRLFAEVLSMLAPLRPKQRDRVLFWLVEDRLSTQAKEQAFQAALPALNPA